jgi:carboxylesterase type B
MTRVSIFALAASVIASPLFFGNKETNPVVSTPVGKIKGVSDGKVQRFLGIPYAQAPVGALRFKKPVPLTPNPNANIDATQYGDACLVRISDAPNPILSFLARVDPPTRSEDCLNLDIYVPEGAKDLPVMVWTFPGGFDTGDSQGLGNYYGNRVLERFPNAIIVSFNARVGPFGYLAGTDLEKEGSLNSGFYDTELVFQWVRANIQAFGGNPKRILAYGNSSGSIITSMHLLTGGGNQNLFDRAILLSGVPGPAGYPSATDTDPFYRRILNGVGCTTLECLRTANATRILEVAETDGFGFGLTADGNIPSSPMESFRTGAVSKVPVIVNSMENEGDLFNARLFGSSIRDATDFSNRMKGLLGRKATSENVAQLMGIYSAQRFGGSLDEAYAAFYGDWVFQCPIAYFAQQMAPISDVWVSRNRHVPQISRLLGNSKAFHTAEIPFVWQSRNFLSPFEYNLANNISKTYIDFANGLVQPGWPKYGSGVRIDVASGRPESDTTLQLEVCKILLQ